MKAPRVRVYLGYCIRRRDEMREVKTGHFGPGWSESTAAMAAGKADLLLVLRHQGTSLYLHVA
jgi:hypothetical protein